MAAVWLHGTWPPEKEGAPQANALYLRPTFVPRLSRKMQREQKQPRYQQSVCTTEPKFCTVACATFYQPQKGTTTRDRRPNSSQQPTRGRSLARRFRASFCATLRVALLDREGRARLSERTLARRNVASMTNRTYCSNVVRPRQPGTLRRASRVPAPSRRSGPETSTP